MLRPCLILNSVITAPKARSGVSHLRFSFFGTLPATLGSWAFDRLARRFFCYRPSARDPFPGYFLIVASVKDEMSGLASTGMVTPCPLTI